MSYAPYPQYPVVETNDIIFLQPWNKRDISWSSVLLWSNTASAPVSGALKDILEQFKNAPATVVNLVLYQKTNTGKSVIPVHPLNK